MYWPADGNATSARCLFCQQNCATYKKETVYPETRCPLSPVLLFDAANGVTKTDSVPQFRIVQRRSRFLNSYIALPNSYIFSQPILRCHMKNCTFNFKAIDGRK